MRQHANEQAVEELTRTRPIHGYEINPNNELGYNQNGNYITK